MTRSDLPEPEVAEASWLARLRATWMAQAPAPSPGFSQAVLQRVNRRRHRRLWVAALAVPATAAMAWMLLVTPGPARQTVTHDAAEATLLASLATAGESWSEAQHVDLYGDDAWFARNDTSSQRTGSHEATVLDGMLPAEYVALVDWLALANVEPQQAGARR